MPALYTSLTVMTALKEAHQAGSPQPTTLVSYEAEIENVFDGRDQDALRETGIDAALPADASRRNRMKVAGEAKTQAFARRLAERGFDALLVRGFAPGASANDVNLVLWRWGADAPSRLVLVDDENRLSR